MPAARRSFAGIDGVVVVLDFSIMPTLVMRYRDFVLRAHDSRDSRIEGSHGKEGSGHVSGHGLIRNPARRGFAARLP